MFEAYLFHLSLYFSIDAPGTYIMQSDANTLPDPSIDGGVVALQSTKEVQLNAYSPIEITLSGIMTLSSKGQPENALSPILVTLFGIVTLCNE